MTAENLLGTRTGAVLASTFGFSSFRPLQQEIVESILAGQDVFALMPTGGGKSLCYQLPALVLDGTCVVVSPLIALMKDQVDALQALGVAATFINSSLDSAEIQRRETMVARGEVKLLYVAPERLMLPGSLRLLDRIQLSLFAIDEAHCISEWGHDFRPEYRALSRLREIFPGVPLGAFTATATSRVRADITTQLNLTDAATFQGSLNRPNLIYDVRPKKRAYAQLVGFLRSRPSSSGIIYCSSRAGTEDLAVRLSSDGIRAIAYHAGLTREERRRRQESFVRDDVPVMTATIAFGMGIDKPDVRFVVHYDLPRTLENYYQESGRAGRDGEPSDCILFFSGGDVMKLRHFAEEKESDADRRIALWQLGQMAGWAESFTCRRRTLLAYFDEPFDRQDPPCCDVCRSPSTEEDATIPAQMFLSCIKRTRERFGAAHVISVLRGSRNQRVLSFGHDKLPTYGIGRDRTEDEWQNLGRELIRNGYVRQDPDRFNTLSVTDRGAAVLFEGAKVVLVSRHAPDSAAETMENIGPRGALFERLQALRKRLADERRLPPYIIFHDRSLRDMAATLPTTREQLGRIHGVGERKVVDFGDAVLSSIADYVRETGATAAPLRPSPAPTERLRGELGHTVRETLRLFREGSSIAEIAKARSLAPSTIEGHLVEAMQAGEELEIDRLVSPERQEPIRASVKALGPDYLGPIMEDLGEGYSYGELRFVRMAMRREEAADQAIDAR